MSLLTEEDSTVLVMITHPCPLLQNAHFLFHLFPWLNLDLVTALDLGLFNVIPLPQRILEIVLSSHVLSDQKISKFFVFNTEASRQDMWL
jgi:hypothetical protein